MEKSVTTLLLFLCVSLQLYATTLAQVDEGQSVSRCAPLRSCRLSCEFGYEEDARGCRVCRCKVDPLSEQLADPGGFCPRPQGPRNPACYFLCPDGYVTTSSGCRICSCLEGPRMREGCRAVGCTLLCNFTGYLRDRRGCPLCQCRGQCSPPSCPARCAVGFINTKDSNGCDVCYCEKCPTLNCPLRCPESKYAYDPVTGCRMCQCMAPDPEPCPRLSCDFTCLDGNQLDQATQCPICLCNPDPRGGRCPRMQCLTQCPNNQFATDTNGCQTCQCGTQCRPLLGCNLINCPDAVGRVRDAQGCEQCQCARATSPCFPSNCVLPCAFQTNGLQRSQDGCEMCACRGADCPPVAVGCNWINCPQGLDQDTGTGCPTCSCSRLASQTRCAPSRCAVICPGGYRRDANNCETCQCAGQCTELTGCAFANCPSGLQTNSQGCDTCSCRDSPNQRCPPIRCPVSCNFGFARDSFTQCETCVCQQPPPCAQLPATCGFTNCPGGLFTDNSGCQRCQCRTHPDQNPRCAPQRCAVAAQCRFGLNRGGPDGCEICSCYVPPSSCPELPPTCNILNCPGGLVRDALGCPQCQCDTRGQPPATCDQITCPSRCQFGYQQDIQRCLVCMCNLPGQSPDCPALTAGACECPRDARPVVDARNCRTCNCDIDMCRGIPEITNCRVKSCEQDGRRCWGCRCVLVVRNRQCQQQSCYKFCRTGFVLDRNGCETCECRPSTSSDVTCPVLSGCGNEVCSNGRRRDARNCETCACNPVNCPAVQCAGQCTFGRRAANQDGCPTCECNCRPLNCALQCSQGLEQDDEGCPVCACRRSVESITDLSLLPCRQRPELLNCRDGPTCSENDLNCRESRFCGENTDNCIECACFRGNQRRGCENLVTQCRLRCPGGYDTDANGCEICRCRGSSCPVFPCTLQCQYGYLVNAQGCVECQCRLRACAQITCPTNPPCRAGFELDAQGCPTCTCRSNDPTCPAARTPCSLNCPYGLRVLDNRNCPLCQCRCARTCTNTCPNGYVYDGNGCPTCQCAPSTCPDFSYCTLSCPQGFQPDTTNGCRLCACLRPPSCPPASCPTSLLCPNGLTYDSQGCIQCSCLECPPLNCDMQCRRGFRTDANGCPRCLCN